MAIRRSRLEEHEVEFRQRVAQLRYAVADLSLERGRVADTGDAAPAVLLDIDYQIGELEKRLGEVSLAEEEAQAGIVGELAQIQASLVAHRESQSAADRQLISLLYQVRPNPCPAQFLREYDALDLLLKAAFGA